jgi:uncharacterized protein YqgV (UPF0045/DUF77 family)
MARNAKGDVQTICDTLVAISKRCHELGPPRIESLLKIDDHMDVVETLESKVSHVVEAQKTS